MDLKEKKIGVFGINGSGKTYFVRRLLQNFKAPLVYRITDDFDNEPNNVKIFKPTDYYQDLDLFLHTAKSWGRAKKIDCVVLDEFDLFTGRFIEQGSPLNELIALHRHDNLSMIFISRRPQDVPAKVYQNLHHLFVFATEGTGAVKNLRELHPDFEVLLPQVSLERHNFVYKQHGMPPALCAPIA